MRAGFELVVEDQSPRKVQAAAPSTMTLKLVLLVSVPSFASEGFVEIQDAEAHRAEGCMRDGVELWLCLIDWFITEPTKCVNP